MGSVALRLMLVGPLPPPPSGASVSFQLFCDKVRGYEKVASLNVINTSPRELKDSPHIISLLNLTKAISILVQYCQMIRQVDQVIIFGSNGFLLSLAPLLLLVARLARKGCYIRAFGGSLDQFMNQLPRILQQLLQSTFRHADGLIIQTELLYRYFAKSLGNKVHLVPGYRTMPGLDYQFVPPEPSNTLRLVFIGHIKAEKGIFILLESLKKINNQENISVVCDIYGPVLESAQAQFQQELSGLKNVTYCDVLEPEAVIATLRDYDLLVFPTFYKGEGHPGVLVEAMMAGRAVITTKFRSIPEIVKDRVNGLLVNANDADDLTRAILEVYFNRGLLRDMAQQNWEKRAAFDADQAIPRFLEVVEPEFGPAVPFDSAIGYED